jgi:hypothetical protein
LKRTISTIEQAGFFLHQAVGRNLKDWVFRVSFATWRNKEWDVTWNKWI